MTKAEIRAVIEIIRVFNIVDCSLNRRYLLLQYPNLAQRLSVDSTFLRIPHNII